MVYCCSGALHIANGGDERMSKIPRVALEFQYDAAFDERKGGVITARLEKAIFKVGRGWIDARRYDREIVLIHRCYPRADSDRHTS